MVACIKLLQPDRSICVVVPFEAMLAGNEVIYNEVDFPLLVVMASAAYKCPTQYYILLGHAQYRKDTWDMLILIPKNAYTLEGHLGEDPKTCTIYNITSGGSLEGHIRKDPSMYYIHCTSNFMSGGFLKGHAGEDARMYHIHNTYLT